MYAEAQKKVDRLKQDTTAAEDQINTGRQAISDIKLEITRLKLDDELVHEEIEQNMLSFKDMEDLLAVQKDNVRIRFHRLPEHTKAQLRKLGYRG
eukprot:g110.t1